jgi:hypothetical protein
MLFSITLTILVVTPILTVMCFLGWAVYSWYSNLEKEHKTHIWYAVLWNIFCLPTLLLGSIVWLICCAVGTTFFLQHIES